MFSNERGMAAKSTSEVEGEIELLSAKRTTRLC